MTTNRARQAFGERVRTYVRQLHGEGAENAFHALRESGPEALGDLASSFKSESVPAVRADLVRIAWQTRSASAVPLLKEALRDEAPSVWKEALDGLVTLGGAEALEVIREARDDVDHLKSQWFAEAEQQIVSREDASRDERR